MNERRKIRRLMGDVKEEYGDRVTDYAKDYGRWYVKRFTHPIKALKEPIPPIPGMPQLRSGAHSETEYRRRVEALEESQKTQPQPDREQVDAIEIKEYGSSAIKPTDNT